MKKRGQSEVITTVLIILLVLAAVFIVYTAVKSMINKSTQTAAGKAECFGTSLEIVSVSTATKNITITREAGGTDKNISGIIILVNGANTPFTVASGSTALGPLETAIVNVPGLKLGDKVKAAVKIGDTVCDASSEFSV